MKQEPLTSGLEQIVSGQLPGNLVHISGPFLGNISTSGTRKGHIYRHVNDQGSAISDTKPSSGHSNNQDCPGIRRCWTERGVVIDSLLGQSNISSWCSNRTMVFQFSTSDSIWVKPGRKLRDQKRLFFWTSACSPDMTLFILRLKMVSIKRQRQRH